MDGVILLSGISLCLCFWIIYLQHRIKMLTFALGEITMVAFAVADGEATIKRSEQGLQIIRKGRYDDEN